MSQLKYIPDVTTLDYDDAKCVGCGMCELVCPHGVFEIVHKKARITDRDRCMECGACAMNCPTSAISVESGVGCAFAIIVGALRGTEPECECTKGDSCC